MKNLIIDSDSIDIRDQADIIKANWNSEREWTCIGLPGDTEDDNAQVVAVVALCHPDNAPLLAAAPKMLETLKDILGLFHDGGLNDQQVFKHILQLAEIAIEIAEQKKTA